MRRALLASLLACTVSCQDPAPSKARHEDPPPAGACPAGDFAWPLPTRAVAVTPSPALKESLSFTDEFIVFDNEVRWAKFVVLVEDPTTVYFQNGNDERFHAEFATAHLDPFVGLSYAEFDALSLRRQGQRAIAGALLFPSDPERREAGIQLSRHDAYHPEMALRILRLVRDHLERPDGTQLFYFPTYEQHACARAAATTYADAGFPLDSPARWLSGNGCYAEGWAIGRLRYVAGAELQTAYAAGSLLATDILLTDAVPAEVPFVAGILTLSPSTPSSHAAILAGSLGMPFAHAGDPALAAPLQSLRDRVVGFGAAQSEPDFLSANPGACQVQLFDLEAHATAAQRQALLDARAPAPLDFAPRQSVGILWKSADELGPADLPVFGGKAAHFGLLRDALPDHSPEALAFSFDLWDRLRAQPTLAGPTLGDAIGTRLAAHTYPPTMAALLSDLAAVRQLIRDTDFAEADKQAVLAALAPFDPSHNLRFRSSTNLEDSETFTGAGLYDSYSGCIADVTDGDDLGPSRCDASEPEERGVFRAIKKVYASFYNDNAFLERLRRGVDESTVGMALLVHAAFPDELELANGVATTTHDNYSFSARLVSQAGAVSVTNPSPGVQAEVVDLSVYDAYAYPSVLTRSSLVPLGGTVLPYDESLDDYSALGTMLRAVSERYATVTGHPPPHRLDFEYKRVEPGELVIKQVRPLASPTSSTTMARLLVGEPVELCVYQGEATDPFAAHRLKSLWAITPATRFLDAAGLATSVYADITYTYASGAGTGVLSGDPSQWTGASHTVVGETMLDSFRVVGAGTPDRTQVLSFAAPPPLPVHESPYFVLSDEGLVLDVEYDAPVTTMPHPGSGDTNPIETRNEQVRLVRCMREGDADLRLTEEVVVSSAGTVTFAMRYFLGPWEYFTLPLGRWDQTTITGLTTEPIVLTSALAQTLMPYHHNFGASYIFEPRRDPTVPAASLAELEAEGIVSFWLPGDGSVHVGDAGGSYRLLE